MQCIQQTRQLDPFAKVALSGPGKVQIRQGECEQISISAPPSMMAYIRSEVRDGTLHIYYQTPQVVSLLDWSDAVDIQLQVCELSQLINTGSARVASKDMDCDSLAIQLTGSGEVAISHLTADRLTVDVTGSGRVTVAGDVESQRILMSANGCYDAETLVSDFGSLRMSGPAVAKVSVSDQLDVMITGNGKVFYSGHPNINKQIYGRGIVNRIRRGRSLLTGVET